MTIGEKIHEYRKQARLSQEELADKMNVTRQSVSLWETDQTTPSLDSLKMLAEIFAVSLDELCDTSTKDGDTTQQCAHETTDCLVSVQTLYTVDLIKHINKITLKKFYVLTIVAAILSMLIALGIASSETNNAYLAIPIFFVVLFVAMIISLSFTIKKRTADLFKLSPNCVVKVMLFQDHFNLEITSDNTESKSTVKYSDIKRVKNDEKCILIYYGNVIVPIEKNLPDIDYDLIFKLLNVPQSNDTSTQQSKKIKALLLVMFILSLLSVFIALFTAVICVQFSPLPEFSITFVEYMWVLYLFIPLPLASAVLGIVFLTKMYKCKKNIIAGFIMCGVLLIYGSFSLVFNDVFSHDFEYVNELEQTLAIDLPDSGYVSREINSDNQSSAMIKFDDVAEIYNVVTSDERFSTNVDFIPANFVGSYYIATTSDYDYFMLFDVTCNKANIANSQHEHHRFIFVAYNVDKNILLVYDFVK